MAFPTRYGLPPSAVILLVVLLVTAAHAVAIKLDGSTTLDHIPPLLDCAPPPPSGNDGGAFRANVLSALGALPAAAAAAPTGFAATRSGRDDDRAFARGLCFGLGQRRGSSPGDCIACLSAAAPDVLAAAASGSGCGASRRAAVWRAGCFLSYADTNASSAREDAFRGWYYDDSDTGPSAALSSQCAGDRAAAADCSRCQNASALVVPALKRRGQRLARVHGDAVVMVGYGCYLRAPIEDARWPWQFRVGILFVINLTVPSIVGIVLEICIWRAVQVQMNPA